MILSFGYSKGTVPRADKVFDVRDLSHDVESPEFVAREKDILSYAKAHKTQNIAIGCEKGKHRSVTIANHVAAKARVSLQHRDR